MDSRTRIAYERAKQVARNQTITIYSEIGGEIGLDMENPQDRNVLRDILCEISTREHEAGRPMLSAVVVHADDMMPGPGFFTLAQELGKFDGVDREAFHIEELKRVHEAWKQV